MTTGQSLLKVYLGLLKIAIVGIVGANLAGVVGMLIAAENKAEYVAPWVHGGWMVGSLVGLVGVLTGKLKFYGEGWVPRRLGGRDQVEESFDAPTKRAGNLEGDRSGEEQSSASKMPTEESTEGKRSSVISSTLFFGFAGGFAGVVLGGTLLLFFFWIAYSPLASSTVAGSVEVVRERTTSHALTQPVMKTKHPVAVWLVLAPTLLGVAVGGITGAIGAALGKVRDG